jgi:tyrosinase
MLPEVSAMTVSRRTVMIQGGVIGAGIIASNVAGLDALAQGQPPLRRSLHGMALNDPILDAWREGVGKLKAATTGNLTWKKFAETHGNASAFNLCPHGNWYFLPWHRAYLLMYEEAVRKLTGHYEFALPYWDWTQDRQMPEAYVQQTFAGNPNPLFESQRDASPTDSLSDEIVGPAVVSQVLGETPFETFGTSRPAGQNNLDQHWINDEFSGIQGTLEGNPHNNVHNFVGGIMASAQSSLDPIFMVHHCNIDRIWWLWNQGGKTDSPDPLWKDMNFHNNFFDANGNQISRKVSDLLVPEPLGYTYATPSLAHAFSAAAAAPAVVASDEKLRSLYGAATPAAASSAGVPTYAAANTQQATGAQHLNIPVKVDPAVLKTVAHRAPVPSGAAAAFGIESTRSALASGPRAICFIRDVASTDHQQTLYRVFLSCDYLTPQTPTTDRHYVGTFGFFGGQHNHGASSGDGRKPSIAVDLTQAVQNVYGSQADPSGEIRVQIQPVPVRPKVEKVGTATPARVEVVVVGA